MNHKRQLASTPSLYQTLCVESSAMKEKNDCAVVALAAVCNVPYVVAHATLAERGRKTRKGTYIDQTLSAVHVLGYTATKINPRSFIETYPKSHHCLKHLTTHHPRRFKKHFDPNKVYLFRTMRHILAVIGGEVNDWSINKAMQVIDVYEITKQQIVLV